MTSSEEFAPNERLRRARSLKGWSQADLAEQVGTSFEIVSRWERGVTVPSPYYRERLCAILGQSAEELGLLRSRPDAFTSLPSPLVLLASSHRDAEKPIVSHLKIALQEQGITLLSSRQLGRQGNGNARNALREAVQAAQVILVIISPEAGSSRHIREAIELASGYQRPVCGVWIEGEHWQEYLPKGSGTLAALIDARTSDGPVLIGEIATALERAGLTAPDNDRPASVDAERDMLVSELPTSSQEPQAVGSTSDRFLEPLAVDTQLPADVPLLPPPPRKRQRGGVSRPTAALLIGLAVLVVAGGILGSLSLLEHFGVLGARSGPPAVIPVRGGTWTADVRRGASLIPNGGGDPFMDNALYLPLFYGDAQGVVHPGAASEIPTVQNGGISPDATIWTFHLRPGLLWSDGVPYDARDVDYSWRLWLNPKFGAGFPNGATGFEVIRSADVSADHLSITFHLKQAYAPFLQNWVDGVFAPLPAHHFSAMAPEQILKSPDSLNPRVTSGPFMMAESVPGDQYTLVRNPRYYRAKEGLPYLDKVVYRIVADENAILQGLQAGTITSASFLIDISQVQAYQRLRNYTLVTPPANSGFEALYFNFHNTVLASHPEVRQAMAMAIDHQALIQQARHGFATPLCTDHPSALHPGYQPDAPCPPFDPTAANKLLSDNDWVRGPSGVRAKDGQRLEFMYSTTIEYHTWRSEDEKILQRNFAALGIKLDIQNYPAQTFFGSFLAAGKASPPTGAVAGRFDIAEFGWTYGYDPDDSVLLACDQIPSAANYFSGANFGSYCNHALDALYQQELVTADPGVRQQVFDQLHYIYLTDFPFITLSSPIFPAIARKGTHNYQPGSFGDTYNIAEWWCDNGKC
jgi:peptide/nickel transport system substrate-binding protein